ncbi:MAG: hypothetical protein WKF48_01400 [Solirubrobacteraceae bacterium]|jgi:hypothetical protein
MSAATRIAAFVALLAVIFTAAAIAGAAIDPSTEDDRGGEKGPVMIR